MDKAFRWVHISDVHFQTKNKSFNTKELIEALPPYLSQMIDNKVDALILSGDFRYAPEGTENPAKVIEFIKELVTSLGLVDSDGKPDFSKVITVPGNHDLNRTGVRKYVIKGAQEEYDVKKGTFETSVLKQLKDDFVFYNNLHRDLGDAPNWSVDNPHCIVQFNDCNLLLLNTAITAGCNEDSGNLVVGSAYIQAALKNIENDNPIIAIGHHGFDEFDKDEKRAIGHYFDQKKIHLYLCGHTHDQWFCTHGENVRQANVGCMMQDEKSVKASFSVGMLDIDGSVYIKSYKWDMDQMGWFEDNANEREYSKLYSVAIDDTCEKKENIKLEKMPNPFSIEGYLLLGSLGCEGIKYFWKKGDEYIESIALNRRVRTNPKEEDLKTSSYTISTSIGCQLHAYNQQCRFCETGTKMFKGPLTSTDIALQAIFMAEYDRECTSYPEVKENFREFSFMGQGEPGFNYPAIRQAIMYIDNVMEKIDQKVSRYVISTCGITDFIPLLIDDIRNNVFKNKVTLHFSLNDVDERRNLIMPVNRTYSYKDVIKRCKALYNVTHEKIGIGILMFDQFEIRNNEPHTLTEKDLRRILTHLDNDVFKIDLCVLNKTSNGIINHQMSNEYAMGLLKVVTQEGFEGKTFASFGDEQGAGCGMLSSDIKDMSSVGNNTIRHFNRSLELLRDAVNYYNGSIY